MRPYHGACIAARTPGSSWTSWTSCLTSLNSLPTLTAGCAVVLVWLLRCGCADGRFGWGWGTMACIRADCGLLTLSGETPLTAVLLKYHRCAPLKGSEDQRNAAAVESV